MRSHFGKGSFLTIAEYAAAQQATMRYMAMM